MKWTQIGRELYALLLALLDEETPVRSKVFVLLVFATVLAYLFSVLDFIPDIIPILGWSDDLIAIIFGTALAERFIPSHIMARCRARAGIVVKENISVQIENDGD
jgi:uncharacterized membrane protein YkvA (DUF1232 family)